jgi:hypothetical protein
MKLITVLLEYTNSSGLRGFLAIVHNHIHLCISDLQFPESSHITSSSILHLHAEIDNTIAIVDGPALDRR